MIRYQVDAAMLGPDWEGDVRAFAADLQRECEVMGWRVTIEAVSSYNGARNYDEEGFPLEDQLPWDFSNLFWDVSDRHNTRGVGG